MKVVQLQAFVVRVPLKRAVKHASHVRRSTDNIIVRCELQDGSVGWGEGVPREYVTGESADAAFELLGKSNWKNLLHPASTFADAVAWIDGLSLPRDAEDDRQCRGNAARCAVELALLDAYGRCFGEPLMTAVKLLTPELVEPKAEVRYSGIVLSSKGWKARAATLAQRLYGLKQLKVKVGIAGQDDAKRLRAIRRFAGRTMELRVDANEAWSAAECLEKIRTLEPFGIASVEQPVSHEEVDALASIRTEVATPIMLDESLCSMVDAERAVAGKTCDLFNLRLSKCGGFLPTLRLALFAKANNIGYQLGCQVGETGILSAAGRQFACMVAGIRALEGSFDRRLVADACTEEDLTFGRGGLAPMLPGCGLGATVVADRIAPLVVRRAVIHE